ncbi:wall-associated receptor kinase 2-like isoform X2 [Rosa chinensis]|uniref:wall-associated receptor kinase 2-like isoform X2 n=1 Tax=Rosa chinensis TaxID=74649 RepID=UPI001AD92035|nr:wall-associated receptor kinase 2-like isoform X2 [Rosa chinensis]
MAVHGRMLVMQLIIVVVIAAAAADRTPSPQAIPGCPDHCGNLTIPYPFGIGEGCFQREGFNLTCNESAEPPTTLLGDGSVTVTNILLAEGELEILSYIAYDCYDQQGNQTEDMYNSPSLQLHPSFTISETRNKFIAVGCDTCAIFKGYLPYPHDEDRYITGCVSVCDSLDNAVNGSCSGIGCCETSIPSGLKNRSITLDSYSQHKDVWGFNPCSYAFIVEEGRFTFNPKTSFEELNNTEKLPMIINWAINEGSCALAQNSPGNACKANSNCVNRTVDNQTEPTGYYCRCLPGFEGNPYLPDGCQGLSIGIFILVVLIW